MLFIFSYLDFLFLHLIKCDCLIIARLVGMQLPSLNPE